MSWYISFSLQKRFDRKREHIWDKKYTVFYGHTIITQFLITSMQTCNPCFQYELKSIGGKTMIFYTCLIISYIYMYIYIYKCMSLAIPGTEPIQVEVSDTYYSYVDANIHNAMVLCTTLQVPILLNTAIIKSCGFGTYGRYVCVSLIRGDSNSARIELYELEVYIGK